MEYKYVAKSLNDTLRLAENLESEKIPNMIICLNGELGAGKTVFTKGFASALGIKDVITSPTFNIIKEYNSGEMPLYHMDVYRLEESDSEIGVEDYFFREGISIIEWSEIIQDKLPNERLEIEIKIINEDARIFLLKPYGKVYEDICDSVL